MQLRAFLLTGLLLAGPGQAETLKPALAGLEFLVGHWSSTTRGSVADTGGSSAGEIAFTAEAGGGVLLRKDHVRLYDAAGKPAGSFDIVMMIYPEAGGLHADYADGEHIIHYTSARVDPGHSVVFSSAAGAETPTFRLSYALNGPKTLDIAFAMAAPGSDAFHPIASGSATRDR